VKTNDSLDSTNEDEVILFFFSELFAFVSDLESSEFDTRMDEVFRLTQSRLLLPFGTSFSIEMPYDIV
jgi:hypothetical protein